MEWFVRGFLRSSLAWLVGGVTLGLCMAVHPAWLVYRPAHMHMNLLGFVTMMIFGVAYHVIPRFTGHALHSRRIAGWQLWVSNAGLALMVAGFIIRVHSRDPGLLLLGAGAAVSALGAYAFVYNLWRTIGPAAGPVAIRRSAVAG
ncbi:MAG TPA: hypothetical protein VK012_04010 [Gemmatimonadales bacterium]|nr:hypothetical protein [Gemmatimonadales bacterium]